MTNGTHELLVRPICLPYLSIKRAEWAHWKRVGCQTAWFYMCFNQLMNSEVAQSTDASLEALALCACPTIPSVCMALEITLVHCGRQQAGLKCQDETAAKWPALGWP